MRFSGIGFGDYGDTHVRFALIENRDRIRRAVRGIKTMFRADGVLPSHPKPVEASTEKSKQEPHGSCFCLWKTPARLGFRKAFSFKPVIKTPFDLLKHLAVWRLQKFNKKSKGVPMGTKRA